MENAKTTYMLTYPQKSIWYLEKLYPDTGIGNIAATLRINEPVDFLLMNQGLNLMLKRNEGFRLRFIEIDGCTQQYISAFHEYQMEYFDFSQDSREQLFIWDQKQTGIPFKLLESDLYYFALIKITEQTYGFYVRIHHLVADAWSLVQLGNEVVSNYMLLKNQQPLPADDNPSYLEFIHSEQTYLQSERYKHDRAFWQEKYAKLPELVTLKNKISNRTGLHAKRKSFIIPDKLVAKIKTYCLENRTSLFALFFAAFCIYINRIKDCQDIIIGTPVLNRSNAREKRTIGMFISTVPIRISIDGEMSFAKFSKMVDKEWFAVLKHQKYPYDCLVKDIRDRSKDIAKLFDLAISYQNAKIKKDDYQVNLEARWHFNEYQVESLYLHINDREDDGSIILNYDYLIDHYYAKEIDFIHDHMIRLLWHALDNPAKILSDIPMLSEKEMETVLYTFNSKKADYPRTETIGSLFERQAAVVPHATALIFGADRLTYAELNAKANRAARILRTKGVGPEIIVGIMVPRSLEMMISILAVVKAGGAYLPIDPNYPEDRIQYILENSGIRILLSRLDLVADLSCNCDIMDVFDASFYDMGDHSDENLPSRNSPQDLLYVIYTSGSTGNPKGMLIEHRNVVRLLFNDQFQFQFSNQDCWTLFHSFCFDFSVWEMYGALLYGGKLVIMPKAVTKDPERFLDLMIQEKVTVLNQTPAAFYNLINADGRRPVQALALRYVIFGGEALKPILLKPFRARYPKTKLINMYGITETTVHVTYLELSDEDIESNICNIGKPIPTTRTYILDRKLNPLPIGIAGEICVGGDGVGRGYLNRDDLTAERFIPNPYLPGDILYRSGDLARFFAKGDIEYLGRIDNQVKIRGHRIELGEIESRMLKFGKIREVIVTTRETPSGSKQLSAYYVPNACFDNADLRMYLVRQLPDYMIPSFLIKIDHLPLNSNGKIDRDKLPLPDSDMLFRETYVEPQDERQAAIARIWSQVLDIEKIGINDNFFLIGGDSLSAVAIVSLIGQRVTFTDLYQNPTIKSFAEAIDHKKNQAADANHVFLIPLTSQTDRIKTSIICFPYGGGNGTAYKELADAVSKRCADCSVYAINLPGHDIGIDQQLLPIQEIAPRLAVEIKTVAEGELILYGHCVGSALAVETAYCLCREQINIKSVYLGGILPPLRKGPLGRYYDPWRMISDRGIINFLGHIGLPAVQLSENHLKQIIRAFRHDVRNFYTYFHEYDDAHPQKLTMPVYCVIGDKDLTTRLYKKKYLKWSRMASSVALYVLKDADHYFIKTHAAELAEILAVPEKLGI